MWPLKSVSQNVVSMKEMVHYSTLVEYLLKPSGIGIEFKNPPGCTICHSSTFD